MRNYIRHPSSIPIEYQIDDDSTGFGQEHLKDVGAGGLSFFSARQLLPGARLIVHIASVEPEFIARARVAWCHTEDNGYSVGVAFTDTKDLFQMRMVEQLCYIEHYKAEVWAREGRQLDGEQAAREWIRRFAHGFPGMDD